MTAEAQGSIGKKGERTKRKILESAAQLFAWYDFDGVTVEDIVKAAGLSKGTFYIYFESKDSLIASFLSDYVNEVDSIYKTFLDSLPAGTKAPDMLLLLIGKIADVITDEIGYHRMMVAYKVQLTGTVNMDAVKGYNRKLYEIIAGVLELGIRQGEFNRQLPLEALTRHLVMAMRGLTYEWCIRYPDFDLKEQALFHFRLLLSGIRFS